MFTKLGTSLKTVIVELANLVGEPAETELEYITI